MSFRPALQRRALAFLGAGWSSLLHVGHAPRAATRDHDTSVRARSRVGAKAAHFIQVVMGATSCWLPVLCPRLPAPFGSCHRSAVRSLIALLCLSLSCFLVPGLLSTAIGQSAQQATPGKYALNVIKKGTPYAVARGDMLSAGNVPDYHVETDPEHCVPNLSMCRIYPETDSCSGTGLSYCRFGWTAKEGGHYFIVTTGELVGRMSVSTIIRE